MNKTCVAAVMAVTLSSLVSKAQDSNVFRNVTAGFELSKPAGWVFVTAQQNLDNLTKTKLNDAEFQKTMLRYATAPMVAMTKHPEPHEDLNPSFKVNIKPLGRFKGESPNALTALLVSQIKPMFKDFALVVSPTNCVVAGLTGSYVRIHYNLETQDGQTFPTASELWIVPRGDFFFMMGAGTRQDEKSGKRSEIEDIIRSIKIEK